MHDGVDVRRTLISGAVVRKHEDAESSTATTDSYKPIKKLKTYSLFFVTLQHF